MQFLSIYCSSLSSRQQDHVTDFQVASFTGISFSRSQYCRVCPGLCLQPVALVVPTFALLSLLFALGSAVMIYDACHSRHSGRVSSSVRDRLLDTSVASTAAPCCPSSWRKITAFCVRYFRSLIETCSSYVLIPCTFVFMMNLETSSFNRADSSERAMIVALPVVMLLFRALAIRQRVVDMTKADQKQLLASSVCSCFVAAVFGLYFNRAKDARLSASSFASETAPQYICLAVLAVQLVVQTTIRLTAVEASIFDETNWPWSSSRFPTSIAKSSVPVTTRSPEIASTGIVMVIAKFLLLNYITLSQIAMVAVGLITGASSSSLDDNSSGTVIGVIPLVSSGILLLHNLVKFLSFLRQKLRFGKRKTTDFDVQDRDSLY